MFLMLKIILFISVSSVMSYQSIWHPSLELQALSNEEQPGLQTFLNHWIFEKGVKIPMKTQGLLKRTAEPEMDQPESKNDWIFGKGIMRQMKRTSEPELHGLKSPDSQNWIYGKGLLMRMRKDWVYDKGLLSRFNTFKRRGMKNGKIRLL